ncbi:MAG: cyclic nucleotide-binding domain-containing protein [Acetatifactor sp.]|nr:cyclic nucleotide-binding domain-containing protein [Acetatifactor sp.]
MAGTVIEPGRKICSAGQPLNALFLIAEGRVAAKYPGGEYYLGKGDVIGISEAVYDVHFITYEATEKCIVAAYPIPSQKALDEFLSKSSDMTRLFLLSSFSQINTLLEHCSIAGLNCNSIFDTLKEDYAKYTEICSHYNIAPGIPGGMDEVETYLSEESPDYWLSSYYMAFSHVLSGDVFKIMVTDPAIPIGLIKKASLDFHKVYMALDEQFHYIRQVNEMYFSESGDDLFKLYTDLYYRLGNDSPDSDELFADINQFILLYANEADSDVDPEILQERIDEFQEKINTMQTEAVTEAPVEKTVVLPEELKDSLNQILEYASLDDETAARLRGNILDYRHMKDKFSTDDESCQLRNAITADFVALYKTVFLKTLNDQTYPVSVKLFLYFGFLDEVLVGNEYTAELLRFLDKVETGYDDGVYTFYNWLMAIYKGKKEPSRNEFDEDYSDSLRKLKAAKKIDDGKMKALENDTLAKVNYELNNLFPTVNKVTYGRISVYCPVFIAENVFKTMDNCFTSAEKIRDNFAYIKSIDYSAYYRETLDIENNNTTGKELLHFEFIPDVILMPNMGIRGSMWQEIEGKRRNTPGRMFLSVFHLEELKVTMIKLTGEFRWELCKRIQGNRWNMISEPSLTSLYYDYAQFYRKNRDLSSEAKEKVRNALQRAKNSFKEMFVRDYAEWIMFEGNGSPRLNKVAREILFNYCPFSKSVCEKVGTNPLFSELINKRNIKNSQRLKRIGLIIQKLDSNGKDVPESLKNEIAFINGEPE